MHIFTWTHCTGHQGLSLGQRKHSLAQSRQQLRSNTFRKVAHGLLVAFKAFYVRLQLWGTMKPLNTCVLYREIDYIDAHFFNSNLTDYLGDWRTNDEESVSRKLSEPVPKTTHIPKTKSGNIGYNCKSFVWTTIDLDCNTSIKIKIKF